MRVAKHKNKLRSFDYTLVYEPGPTNPTDWSSRNPPPAKEYSVFEQDWFGIETEEEDAEILICRLEDLNDAVTMEVLQAYSKCDDTLAKIVEHLKVGIKLDKDLQDAGYKQV